MRVLVTGAQGFIGSWIVKLLVERGEYVLLHDIAHHYRRLGMLMSEERARQLPTISCDITDVRALSRAIGEHGITHVIHLAALQVPACKANPIRGAEVNVIGTLAVFEAVREHLPHVARVVYASSVAVIGPEDAYPPGPVPNEGPLLPATHYGVFKQTNEASARIYAQDYGISSVGLRPWTVYGPGRDQGMTSDPTRAMKAAVVGRPFTIRFTGRTDMQYVEDVARTFIRAAEVPYEGAGAYNLRGAVVTVDEIIRQIEELWPSARGLISATGGQLPIAPELDDRKLREEIGEVPKTPLAEGIQKTLRHFDMLRREGRLELHDLEE